jgi:hypothetical protein
MLCDISKVHTGFMIMPRLTHCTEDSHWGQPGYSKKVFAAKSPLNAGGYVSSDKVIERIENKYWKIEVSDFQAWFLGFYQFTGEWQCTELAPDKIQIDYTYTMHGKKMLLYPLQWLFTKTFWRIYMGKILENVRILAEGDEPYRHA